MQWFWWYVYQSDNQIEHLIIFIPLQNAGNGKLNAEMLHTTTTSNQHTGMADVSNVQKHKMFFFFQNYYLLSFFLAVVQIIADYRILLQESKTLIMIVFNLSKYLAHFIAYKIIIHFVLSLCAKALTLLQSNFWSNSSKQFIIINYIPHYYYKSRRNEIST